MNFNNFENIIKKQVRGKQENYDINELFKNPILHRQIHGEIIYIPLDIERLWGYK